MRSYILDQLQTYKLNPSDDILITVYMILLV